MIRKKQNANIDYKIIINVRVLLTIFLEHSNMVLHFDTKIESVVLRIISGIRPRVSTRLP